MKVVKLISRLVSGVFKLAFKLLAVFTVLAIIFGVHVAFNITVFITVIILFLFINNLFSVLAENVPSKQKTRKHRFYDFYEHDHWTPGQPAVTPKAYEQGFFYGHHGD